MFSQTLTSHQRFSSLSVAAVFLVPNTYGDSQWSTTLHSQTAYHMESNHLSQQEWVLDTEWSRELGAGNMTAIFRLRLDTVDDLNDEDYGVPHTYSTLGGPIFMGPLGEQGIREWYWETHTDSVFWRIGKQQVVWGEADGLKVLDVINPQSFREFILDDFDDSRIPLWMLNAEISVRDSGILQVLWIPDTTTHELAPTTSPFAFTSPALVPQLPATSTGFEININEARAPSNGFEDSDLGIRWSQFIGGWDYSLNYLYHYVDVPVVTAELEDNQLTIHQDFERSHLLGFSASKSWGDWVFRIESAYETDRYHRTNETLPGVIKSNQWSTVLGLDWQGLTDNFFSAQFFETVIMKDDTNSQLVNERNETQMTFLWERNYLNETVKTSWLQLHSLNHDDGLVQVQVEYNWSDELDIYAGVDVFYGEEEGLYGQFKKNDRFNIGFSFVFE